MYLKYFNQHLHLYFNMYAINGFSRDWIVIYIINIFQYTIYNKV